MAVVMNATHFLLDARLADDCSDYYCNHSSPHKPSDPSHQIPMTRNDFRLAMLLRLARIEPSDLGSIDSVFSELDEDGSGTLDPNDVVHHQEDALRHRIARLDELTGKKHGKGKH
eukprot:COSAG04_NODE_19470_length_415_cov_1.645570_1_plen_114_part_01